MQYHLVVIADVAEDGSVTWRMCEPGSEPVDSRMSAWDPQTQNWVEGDIKLWDQLDHDLANLLPQDTASESR